METIKTKIKRARPALLTVLGGMSAVALLFGAVSIGIASSKTGSQRPAQVADKENLEEQLATVKSQLATVQQELFGKKAKKGALDNAGKKTLETDGGTAQKMLKLSLSQAVFGKGIGKEAEATMLLDGLLKNGFELDKTLKSNDGKKSAIAIKKS